MNEVEFKIKTLDKKIIYGILNEKTKNNKLVILSLGFTSYMFDSIYKSSVDSFCNNKFSTFRFNFFDYRLNARRLHHTSMLTH